METSKTIEEEIRYLSPYSILIIGNSGLRRLFCPFQVQSLEKSSTIGQSKIVWVEEVRTSSDHRLLYLINKIAYPYYDFIILL